MHSLVKVGRRGKENKYEVPEPAQQSAPKTEYHRLGVCCGVANVSTRQTATPRNAHPLIRTFALGKLKITFHHQHHNEQNF